MGKATRWLRGLLGLRKDKENVDKNPIFSEKKEKKKWAFTKSGDESAPLHQIPANDFDWLRYLIADSEMEQSKHAIAVAAATAAAADAAVAAAQAAVAVVRLTSQGRGGFFADGTGRAAAMRIQAVFRGYLARKALRALKGLVKLQALVRGYLVRKRAAATLHSMQALFRAQASVRSQRARRSMSTDYRSHPQIKARRKSTERLDDMRSEFHSKRLSSSHDPSFDESPKTVEIDTCGPRLRSRRMSTCVSEYYGDPHFQLLSSPIIPCPMTNRTPIHSCHHNRDFDWGFVHDYKFATAQNTPRFGCSGSGRAYAVTTPAAKSACWESGVLEPHNSTCPSYMANTQCFRAKLRSHSAPKQRPKKEVSLTEMMASRASFSGVRMKCSSSMSCSDQAQEGF